MSLRQKVAFYLEDIETPIGRTINLLITALVVISSAIFVADTYPIPPAIRQGLALLDNGILIVFTIEYLLRFWCAENKIKYLFSLYSMIDLVAILPVFISGTDFRFIRILRWLRILRLVRFIEGRTLFGYVSSEDSRIITRIFFTLFAIIFVYSGLIYQVEHPMNTENFSTFLDALYFSVATMTTVGFGDVTPVSQLGRMLTVLMILSGIALIPWQIGDLIKRLVKTSNQLETPCTGCGTLLHEMDARFCRMCGTALRQGETAVPLDPP